MEAAEKTLQTAENLLAEATRDLGECDHGPHYVYPVHLRHGNACQLATELSSGRTR